MALWSKGRGPGYTLHSFWHSERAVGAHQVCSAPTGCPLSGLVGFFLTCMALSVFLCFLTRTEQLLGKANNQRITPFGRKAV